MDGNERRWMDSIHTSFHVFDEIRRDRYEHFLFGIERRKGRMHGIFMIFLLNYPLIQNIVVIDL